FVAYQTAFLKAHYPSEYMAAVLNNQGNIDKIKFYMEECQRMGLQVLGPDVNESLKGFSVNKEGIVRFGMNAIKGVGEAAVEDVIAEREANGPYVSVFDFIQRVNQRTVNKRTLENLVLAGALDCFKDLHRAQYFFAPPTDPKTGLERLVVFGNQYQASSTMATNSLFGEMSMPDVKPPVIPLCEPWTLPELLDREKEVIGIYLSAHPMDGFRFEMDHYNFLPVAELESNKGRVVRIAGFVTDAAHMTTKKGSKFGKLLLNDYSGHQEIVFWQDNYVQYNNFIDNGQTLMVQGVYGEHKYRPGVMEFQIQNIMLLDNVRKALTKRIYIRLPLQHVDTVLIQFFTENVKSNPGNTDFVIQVVDETTQLITKLKSSQAKLGLNDDLIQFLDSDDKLQYSIETA
ncbi:MAG TPA: OB-fold nucleic acid binding domain-containing protein, partial [Flavipsychrobacter sp.]|nr:OB-fold nucleic acid binding domain-containing protein [Flavipsychrobacter sp.]